MKRNLLPFVGGNHKYRAADEATLIECMDNDTLWDKENGERPVILLKDAKPRTSVVLDLEGRLCFIGDAETAERVVEDDNRCDDEEGYKGENNKEITKKERVKFKLGCEYGSYIEDIDREDPLIKAILSDNVEEFVSLDSAPCFNPNTDLFPKFRYIHLIVLSGVVKCFKHAISTNFYDLEGIAPYAVLGGNLEIIRILEQQGIRFDHMLPFTRNPGIAEWLLEHWENTVNDVVSVCKDPKRWSWAPHLLKRLSKLDEENFNSNASDVCFAACRNGSFFS